MEHNCTKAKPHKKVQKKNKKKVVGGGVQEIPDWITIVLKQRLTKKYRMKEHNSYNEVQ